MQRAKRKNEGKGPIGSSEQQQGQEQPEGRQEQQGQAKAYIDDVHIKMLDLRQSLTSSSSLLVQQPRERQQHPAAATASTTSAVSATRHIRSTDLFHASTRHRYTQLPAFHNHSNSNNNIRYNISQLVMRCHLLPQPRLPPSCPHQNQPPTTSRPSTRRTSVSEGNHQASGTTVTSSTSTS